MRFKEKLVALIACVALAVSFVPAAAIAKAPDDAGKASQTSTSKVEKSDKGSEVSKPGKDADSSSSSSSNSSTMAVKLSFGEGYEAEQGSVWVNNDGKWYSVTKDTDVASLAVTGDSALFRVVPAEGYDVDWSSMTYSVGGGEAQAVKGDVKKALESEEGYKVAVSDGSFALEGVAFTAQPPRTVTVSVDKASYPLLSGGTVKMTLGTGGSNDVEFKKNGGTYDLPAASAEKTVITFTTDKSHFVQNAIVNGTSHPTAIVETTEADKAAFSVTLESAEATPKDGKFDLKLSIGAHATVDNKAKHITKDSVTASYLITKDGEAVMDEAKVSLSISDEEIDKSIPGAFATFDFDLAIDGKEVDEIKSPLLIKMGLDTNEYKATNIAVMNKHNGTTSTVPSYYDSNTGKLQMQSSEFSDYTLVDKDKATTSSSTKTTAASSKSTTPKTGDALMAVLPVASVISLAALALIVLALRKMKQGQ